MGAACRGIGPSVKALHTFVFREVFTVDLSKYWPPPVITRSDRPPARRPESERRRPLISWRGAESPGAVTLVTEGRTRGTVFLLTRKALQTLTFGVAT